MMRARHSFPLLLLLCSALLAARASGDAAGAYLAARQEAGPALLSPSQAADVVRHPGGYAGRALDVAATVSGIVSAGGARTALLTVGGDTVAVPVPPTLHGASWLDSGARVRVLLRVEGDDGTLPQGLRLLAAAPEGDVAAQEARQDADVRAARLESARSSALASRFLPARGNGYGVRSVGTDGSTGHPAGALPARALAVFVPYRALVRRWNRRLSDDQVDRITTSILYFSDQNDLDPRLVVATIIAESDFDVNSTSRAGAMGLAQIMPDEARSLGVTDAYDPVQNIGAAVHLLRRNLDKYGGAPAAAGVIPLNQIALTMAAYNAGPGAVHKYHGVPPYRETRRYVARIQALYRQMCGTTDAQVARRK